MIIFTQYLETLHFLREELGKYYGPEKIAVIRGGPLEEKIASCESFWDEKGAQYLICTSAGGEGINLQICRILFNYDLPWNPMAVEQRIGRIHRYGQMETAQIYNLVAEGTIEERVYALLEQKLLEIARTIGKVDSTTGEVVEDFRSEVLGYLGSSVSYNDLYKEALINRDYERTEKEIREAIEKAKEASDALRQLTQDLTAFNLDNYIELKGRYSLDDLRLFCEKAVIGLGGSFIPSGEVVNIGVPEALRRYPGVSSRYENVTFSRKTATRKKGVDLLGIGHPLVDALIIHLKSDIVSGDVMNIKGTDTAEYTAARYLFTLDLDDQSKREIYKEFTVSGNYVKNDIQLLMQNQWTESEETPECGDIKDQLSMITRNYEAQIRSKYEGVVNIRGKCVGLISVK